MTQPTGQPYWPQSTTPDPGIHSGNPDAGLSGLSQQQINALRQELIQIAVQTVYQALTGIFPIGASAFQLLKAWGNVVPLLNIVTNLLPVGVIPDTPLVTQSANTLSQQSIAKPGYLAIDTTADSVFPITNIQGSSPTTINVTSSSSVLGFIPTPDNGKKQSIIWLGQGTTNITGLYINLYQLNLATGVCALIEASTNIIGAVSNTMSWNYYDLPTAINSQVGNVYAVELVVTGTGTYQIAGMANSWLPANTQIYPQQLGATRTTGLPSAPSTFTPTYSSNIPWFGLGGFLFAGPLRTQYNVAGTYTYPIPSWLKWGDKIDVIPLGAGAGGQASLFYAVGNGGNPGQWGPQTLVYGVDIPITTTTLTVVVGAGGTAGTSAGQIGGNGGASSVSGTGVTTITAPGGTGQSGGNTAGPGPGNQVFNGITYTGGSTVGTGTHGSGPGGAGGGGGAYGSGAAGADGSVWLDAYQAGTNP